MFTFLSIMASGTFMGYLLRNKNQIHKIPYLIQIVVCTLLFLLGLSVGENKLIVENFSYYCGQAALISFLSIMGSLVAALILYNCCFKKGGHHEE